MANALSKGCSTWKWVKNFKSLGPLEMFECFICFPTFEPHRSSIMKKQSGMDASTIHTQSTLAFAKQ